MRLLFAFALVILLSHVSRATTYYMATSGSDSSSGLSQAAPWLTPNHSVNCGDVILAAPGAYKPLNGVFGPVSCTANNNVAWLKCTTFDTCTVTLYSEGGSTGFNYSAVGVYINNSYWGIQGWGVSNPTTSYDTQACINVAMGIHHVVIANNVVNVCGGAGIGAGVDYAAVIGNAVYGAGTSNTDCHSGIDIFAPAQTDNLPGTHIYVAQNVVWGTTNPSYAPPNGCYDGNGIITDTLDYYSSDNKNYVCKTFTGQVLIENNITVSNGGVGVRLEYSGPEDNFSHCTGPTPTTFAVQVARNNTAWGNSTGMNSYGFGSRTGGEFQIQAATNITYTANLANDPEQYLFSDAYAETDGSQPLYPYSAAFQCAACDNQDTVQGNWIYSQYNSPQITSRTGDIPYATTFAYGNNITDVDPAFRSPQVPPAPNCSGYSSVLDCMAVVISNFKPTASGSQAYGRQDPSPTPTSDPLSPQWLSSVTGIPQGILPPQRKGSADSGSSVL